MPKISPAARTAQARRIREDESNRLHDVVPELKGLRFNIEDQAAFEVAPPLTYIRHVIVATAPAMFDLPCLDRKCEDGGHDVTGRVLSGLKRRADAIDGSSRCRGTRNGEPCERELNFRLSASYE
jgi:hypothetical protein